MNTTITAQHAEEWTITPFLGEGGSDILPVVPLFVVEQQNGAYIRTEDLKRILTFTNRADAEDYILDFDPFLDGHRVKNLGLHPTVPFALVTRDASPEAAPAAAPAKKKKLPPLLGARLAIFVPCADCEGKGYHDFGYESRALCLTCDGKKETLEPLSGSDLLDMIADAMDARGRGER